MTPSATRPTDPVVLDNIAWTVDPLALAGKLRLAERPRLRDAFVALAAAAGRIARPRVLYRAVYVDSRSEDGVVLDGVAFTSRVLRVNLDGAHRAFAHVCTCGAELDAWAATFADPLERYWADALCQAALRRASNALRAELQHRLGIARLSTMAPGSLPDWPLEQQLPLFQLIGDVQGLAGVTLTPSLMMVPAKSTSGISFATETTFESCQLCPREDCPGRRAAYEPGLYERKYR